MSATAQSTSAEGNESLTHRGPFTLGDYVLHERLAQGGMASVYLAVRAGAEGFRRWFAVKVIRPHLAGDTAFIRMFLDEARLLSRINHPNVCAVFDAGSHQNQHFLVMEFLQGESLSEVLRVLSGLGTAIAPHTAARIISDAARGLHAAHDLRNADGTLAQVIHRDVSPQNIFVLYDGVTKVVDFGVARSRDRIAESTQSGIVKGKLAYLAPEQLGDGPVDCRADIFALGIVLWESVMGRRLFRRETEAATMKAVLSGAIEDPRTTDPRFPPALGRILMKMLQRDPARRYQSADHVARDLDAYLSTSGTAASPADVADFLRALFADRIDAQSRRVRALLETPSALSQRSASVPPPPLSPSTPPSVSRERPIAARRGSDAAPNDAQPATDAALIVPRELRLPIRRAWVLSLLGLVAIVGVVAAMQTLEQASLSAISGRGSMRARIYTHFAHPEPTPTPTPTPPVAAPLTAPTVAPVVFADAGAPGVALPAAPPTELAPPTNARSDRRHHTTHHGHSVRDGGAGVWINEYEGHR